MKNAVKYHPKKLQIKSEDFVMPFGKHKHQSIEWILEFNPGYILWMAENDVADISDEIYHQAEVNDREEFDPMYPDAFSEYFDDPPY